MINQRPQWFEPALSSLFQKRELDASLVQEAMTDLVTGTADESLAAAFITSLRTKGETSLEIATAAKVLRQSMICLDSRGQRVVDTCGTGGDDAGTFNISTAAAIVTCACGMKVVKHGNRAVSGKTGSADVLREFGVPIENGVQWAQKCLDQFGFAFCYAPDFHPAMANVAALRKKLGVRTIFNLLGPLSNPSHAHFQIIGVGKRELLEPLAGAVKILNTERTVLAHGLDGLDEVTLACPTEIRIVENSTVRNEQWDPQEFDLQPATIKDIQAFDANHSADMIRRVLDGESSPASRFVIANVAATLWTARQVDTLKQGVERAIDAIQSGAAKEVLIKLINS